MATELRVNWILCDGYGLCGDLIPELIGLDDWRYPIIRPGGVPRELLDAAQRAVDCCPMLALRLDALGDARTKAVPARNADRPRA
jgi:ferredoxin